MPTRYLLACILLSACGGDNAPAADDDTTSAMPPGDGTSTTVDATTGGCVAGYEGCPCAADGACLSGLACYSNLCVDPGIATSTSGPDPTTGSEPGTTTRADDGTSSTGDGSPSTGSSEGSSSTTEATPECLEGDNYCAVDQFQTCVGGVWEQTSCEDHCLLSGYHSPGCASADACTCDGFADDVCQEAAYNLCICADLDYGIPCTQDQWNEFYDECFNMVNDYVLCFYDYPIVMATDCGPAEDACL